MDEVEEGIPEIVEPHLNRMVVKDTVERIAEELEKALSEGSIEEILQSYHALAHEIDMSNMSLADQHQLAKEVRKTIAGRIRRG